MTPKEQRLEALKDKIDEFKERGLINHFDYINLHLLLNEFIGLYFFKDKKENTGGWWKKAYYTLIGSMILRQGGPRDLLVNDTVGYKLFGDFARRYRLKTLTSTMVLVKESNPVTGGGHGLELLSGRFPVDYYLHPKYGEISVEMYDFAVQVCIVLNDYDKDGHC